MTKILHIITSLGDGGAEGVLNRLINSTRDHSHVVISLQDYGKYGAELQKSGVVVYQLQCFSVLSFIYSFWKIVSILRREKPSIVQTWMYHADFIGGIAAKWVGSCYVIWGLRNSNLNKSMSAWQTRLINYLNAKLSHTIPDAIVCCAMSVRECHVDLGYDSSKAIVIDNGFDTNKFKPIDLKIQSEFNDAMPDCIHIGVVGRYAPQKDHDTFLNAIEILVEREIRLKISIIGTGVKCSEMFEKIKERNLGDYVTLLEPIAEIENFYRTIHLLVLSSAFGEGFPNVLAEAMATAVPCVATDVGDSKHIVGDYGWIVRPQDPLALANALCEAISLFNSNRIEWAALCRNARTRICDNFSLESMKSQFIRLWSKSKESLSCAE